MNENIAVDITNIIKSKGITFTVPYHGEEPTKYVSQNKSAISLNRLYATAENVQAVRDALAELNITFKEDWSPNFHINFKLIW